MNWAEWIARISPWDPCRTWKTQAGLWAQQYERETGKHQFPASLPVHIISGQWVKDQDIADAKQWVAQSGMAQLMEEALAIEIVADPIPNQVGEGGTIDATRRAILLRDMYYMPKWDMAGAMLHEAWHLWQFRHGMGGYPLPMLESQAYAIQQLFNNRSGHADDIILARNPSARRACGLPT